MTGMLELYGKDLKAAMIKMLQQAIANAPEAHKEIKHIKKNQEFWN